MEILQTIITEAHLPVILAFDAEPCEERPHIREELMDEHAQLVRASVGRSFGDLVDKLTEFDCRIMQFWDLERHEYRQWLREHYAENFAEFEKKYDSNPMKWL